METNFYKGSASFGRHDLHVREREGKRGERKEKGGENRGKRRDKEGEGRGKEREREKKGRERKGKGGKREEKK